MPNPMKRRAHALAIWQAAVAAVHPDRLVRDSLYVVGNSLRVGRWRLDLSGIERLFVVGTGKASAAMAGAVESTLGGKLCREKQVQGCVAVPDYAVRPTRWIELHAARSGNANEPTPAGVAAAARIVELLASTTPRDLVLCLISGGGSALLPAPATGISLDDKRRITESLHRCGATINEMNAVRKHLSELKGGGLVQKCRARVVSLIISDVVGDPLDVIASGPTAADSTTFSTAIHVLDKYGLNQQTPASVLDRLRRGRAGEIPETLKRLPRRVQNCVIGSNAVALQAAASTARALGYRVLDLGSCIEGESREVARALAGIALSAQQDSRPVRAPACILSGGECTVSLGSHTGKGGRNQEWALAALVHLGDRISGMTFLSGGTDGEDGPTDAAGAVADEAIARTAKDLDLRPQQFLNSHDSYHFFAPTGGLVRSGLTHTNVMDVRVILVT